MERAEIVEILNNALVEEFELDEKALVPGAHIRDDLGLDSLDIVDMIIVIEKAFKTKLENKKGLAEIQTLGDIYDFLENLQAQGLGQEGDAKE